jgi:hypothetical protein
MEMNETIIAMVGKLTDEVGHLNGCNVELEKQVTALQGLVAGPAGPSTCRSEEQVIVVP